MSNLDGATYAAFTIELSVASTETIQVEWFTEDGTAKAGTDYEATTGLLTFQPGELSKQVQVLVFGRDPADTQEDRNFHMRVKPPINAILGTSLSDVVISILDSDGTTIAALIVPTGPKGGKGDTGLSAYEEAFLQDPSVGTLTEWLESLKGEGRLIELQKGATAIQWRYVGDIPWIDLVQLADLKGGKGDDGPAIQMQATATYIQWRVTGTTVWNNLIAVADLKGSKGDTGASLVNKGAWAAKTYNPGEYTFSTSSTSSNNSLWFLLDVAPYASTVMPKDDVTHWQELTVPPGVPGASVELQKSVTAIQWRQVGGTTWTDLVLLADLKGDDGTSVELQKTATYVQWRLVGASTWINLIALADLTGPTGKNIELQTTATYIQWRVVGDTTWINLVELSTLKGADGSKWLTGTIVPAAGIGNDGDSYLRTPVGEIYQKASGAWALLMTIAGGTSTGVQWFSSTSVPGNTVGKDGDLHLHEATGQIRKRVTVSGTTTWNSLILIPPLATSAQAKAAASASISATPAGVREFMEQYGFTSSYTIDATDLNALTGATDRTVVFGFNNSTLNIPFSGAYGRGIMFAGGGNFSTQVAWINGTNDQYVRNNNGTTWGAWAKQGYNDNDSISTAWSTLTTAGGWSAQSQGAKYRKVNGKLEVAIYITGGTVTDGTVVGNLPAGYIPANQIGVLAISQTGSAGTYPPRLYFNTNGSITIYGVTGSPVQAVAIIPIN